MIPLLPRLLRPGLLLALPAVLLLSSCGEAPPAGGAAKGGKSGKGGGAAPVLAAKVERKVVPLSLEAIGAVEGRPYRISGAQPEGCSPVAIAFKAGETEVRPVKPNTVARSLAIGSRQPPLRHHGVKHRGPPSLQGRQVLLRRQPIR